MTINYAALGQTEEEIILLREHDKGETLHEFAAPSAEEPQFCDECGDTAEGLMHNNTWRNVEPLMAK